ncbi:MAG: flagellar basal body P-ring protein FlgI [Bryobacteraceae bacterium]|jgi:flagellar P-ring protein precursor FlgI
MKKAIAAILLASISSGAATRLKELVALEGVRDNQLLGYGLVVGLAGTGDRQQTLFPAQSLANMLERMGLTINPTTIQVKNTAAVMVTATLPPFAQAGSRIDATIAAIGDSPSLQGGILLMTSLKGPDNQVFAVAQGPLILGGFMAGGGANAKTMNHPTVGRIPNGAIVERTAPSPPLGNIVKLQLDRADFTTATRVAEALNKRFGKVAHAESAALVTVTLPTEFQNDPTGFVSEFERLTVEVDRTAEIVVNERTGTIIMGKDVRIAPVAILQGSLTVEIETTLQVSQPNALSQGTTQVVPKVAVGASQQPVRNVMLKQGATVEELVQALTSIGSSPRDIISILQNLKDAGAIEAELRVI